VNHLNAQVLDNTPHAPHIHSDRLADPLPYLTFLSAVVGPAASSWRQAAAGIEADALLVKSEATRHGFAIAARNNAAEE